LSSVQDKPTKTEAIEDAGITRSQAYDLQTIAANPEIVEAVIAKAGCKSNEVTEVTELTKGQAEKDAGISHAVAIDLQAMAANPEVVEGAANVHN
jgi:hypothetical protein